MVYRAAWEEALSLELLEEVDSRDSRSSRKKDVCARSIAPRLSRDLYLSRRSSNGERTEPPCRELSFGDRLLRGMLESQR